MESTLKSEAKTKGRKVEGLAIVARIGSWTSPTGPQWESPAIDFTVNGETFYWRSTSEYPVEGLRRGMSVNLRAFAKNNGNLYRVSWSPLPATFPTCEQVLHCQTCEGK